jgi:hypothetical protein
VGMPFLITCAGTGAWTSVWHFASKPRRFGAIASGSSARYRCTTLAFRLYSLATAAADGSDGRHASRICALDCALCLRCMARVTAPSNVSTSSIADTMPCGS